MRYNQTPLLIDREPPAFKTPSRFGDNTQSFPCNVVQRCAVADSCPATEPDSKENAEAARGERHPELGDQDLREIAAVSTGLPHPSPEPARFVDVAYAAPRTCRQYTVNDLS